MRVTIAAGLALLMAGCGSPSSTVTQSADGGAKVESQGASVTVNAKDCARAAHAPLYADARITTCVADHQTEGEKRGSVIFITPAAPAAVLAWYKGEAQKAGLKLNIETNMSISASEGKKTLMVMAMPQGSETAVTVNWGE